MDHIRNNPKLLTAIGAAAVVLILVAVSLWNQVSEKRDLEKEHETLISKLNAVELAIAKNQADYDQQKAESVTEATGLDPAVVRGDAVEAEKYFAPAFSWKSAQEYEKVRGQYIESLGKSNTFTATYLPPDTKIDTNNGKLSYIDFKGFRSTMGGIHVVPLKADGNRVRYVAFVNYFMHKSDADLADKSALQTSSAIIEFTAAGSGSEGGRRITEVNARAGFQSSQER